MQVTFKSFEDWGTDMFAIQDFQGITNDDTDYYMAGAVIFEDEILENVLDFVDMAAQAGSAIIIVETCWLMKIANESPEITEKVYDIFKSIENAAQENGFISHPDVYESKMVFFNESEDEDECGE